MDTTTNAVSVAGRFRHLQSRLPALGRGELREALSPIIAELRFLPAGAETRAAGEAALDICHVLFGGARSVDALPLIRAVIESAGSDDVQRRRSLSACGILLADSGDVVGAITHHIEALQIANAMGLAVEAGHTWNNLGLAFGVAGHYGLAMNCYRRALAVVEEVPGPLRGRYAAWSNLANACHHFGRHAEGLEYMRRALAERTPEILAADRHGAILLERNFVRLLVATGDLDEARLHVQALAIIAGEYNTPRAAVAAATARATYEIATGHIDVAMTRLEQALATARGTPAVLRDTLAFAARAEEAAGNPERALLRMRELSGHIYRLAVDRAREHVELARMADTPGTETLHELARVRLESQLRSPQEPPEWQTLRRLSMGAALRFDASGEHGPRVGTLTKALALESGVAPLEALEIGLAAEVHDIGMGSVPEALASKMGPLNPVEEELMRRHADAGAEILRDDRHPRMLIARDIAQYHHAWWDGSGYPERVGGQFIPRAARLCAVANAYDGLVCGFGGEAACSMEGALGELHRRAGSELEPALVANFDRMIRRESWELGIDPAGIAGAASFQELVATLQEDRGFA